MVVHAIHENATCFLKLSLAAHEDNRIELNEPFTCSLCNSNACARKGGMLVVVCGVSPAHADLMQISR